MNKSQCSTLIKRSKSRVGCLYRKEVAEVKLILNLSLLTWPQSVPLLPGFYSYSKLKTG